LISAVVEGSDAELVARCAAGDERAWSTLVERYSRYVHAIVHQAFGLRGHDAEDAFQDVFLRVYERLGTLRDVDAFRPWLAQLTRRRCLDLLARRTEDPLDDVELAASDVLEELDQALVVRDALGRLDDPCRDILDRFFARDESYHAISDALAIPAGTIASRISRCLAKLRTQLDGRLSAPVPSSGSVEL
jgi:RNA polymerase sigma-70 factor (ECF subfamily)